MIRKASAVWEGDLKSGTGKTSTESGALNNVHYSFTKRFGDEPGTNPEELIGAAHAGCFSMALAHGLAGEGYTVENISTTAKVHLENVDGGFKITLIELVTEARVPGVDEAKFQEIANGTKTGCPVSKALAATEIQLNATLV